MEGPTWQMQNVNKAEKHTPKVDAACHSVTFYDMIMEEFGYFWHFMMLIDHIDDILILTFENYSLSRCGGLEPMWRL